MLDKEAIIKRAEVYHSKTGPVVAAVKEVLGTTYPAGTNLILVFVQKFIGLKYGAKNMCMDKVVDCAELWRITFYIWFGMDIGSYSDAQYLNKNGTIVTDDFDTLPKCRPLDLVFYKTSSSKRSGHVAAIFDSARIFHSGASENGAKVNFSKITWGKRYFTKAMYVKRFLSDEQYSSIIVGGAIPHVTEVTYTRMLKLKIPYMHGEDVLKVQTALKGFGYFKGALGGNYGPITRAAVKAYQKSRGLEVDGIVGPITWARLFG